MRTDTNYKLHELEVRDYLTKHTTKFVSDYITAYFTPTTGEHNECEELILSTVDSIQEPINDIAQSITQTICWKLGIKTQFIVKDTHAS